MADHLDNPGLTSPAMDARVDITDIYVFQKPGNPGKSTLILNVNPLAPAHADEFRHDALYELLVDSTQNQYFLSITPMLGAFTQVVTSGLPSATTFSDCRDRGRA